MLKMRANILWIDKASSKLMRQLDLTTNELFESIAILEKKAVKKEDPNPINKNALDKHLSSIEQIYTDAISKDEGMRPRVEAELKKIDHLYKGLVSKIEKSKKNSFEGQVKKIGKLKERLFPEQKLQERSVNLLHFCNHKGPRERIEDLYNAIDPLSTDFTILIENETK
jgi:soluble cytochrome b562